MGNNRRFWIALISVDWGAVLNFGSSVCPNEFSHTEREPICDTMGDAQSSAIVFYLQQQRSCCRVHFEKEAPASILAAILTTCVLFAWKMEAWCVGRTDWLIISLSITRISALLTGVFLSIATAIRIRNTDRTMSQLIIKPSILLRKKRKRDLKADSFSTICEIITRALSLSRENLHYPDAIKHFVGNDITKPCTRKISSKSNSLLLHESCVTQMAST